MTDAKAPDITSKTRSGIALNKSIPNPAESVNTQFSESENDTNRYSLTEEALADEGKRTDSRTVLSRALETVGESQKIREKYLTPQNEHDIIRRVARKTDMLL